MKQELIRLDGERVWVELLHFAWHTSHELHDCNTIYEEIGIAMEFLSCVFSHCRLSFLFLKDKWTNSAQ